MRLGVAAAFEGAGLEVQVHLLVQLVDDVLQRLLLPVEDLLLGEPEAEVGALAVLQPLHQLRQRLARRPVELGPEERLEPALDVQTDLESAVQEPPQGDQEVEGARHRQPPPAMKRSARMPGMKK